MRLLCILLATALTSLAAMNADAEDSRAFEFIYAGAVTDLEPGTKARIWIPIAQTGEHQTVRQGAIKLPAKHQISRESKYGNRILFFEAAANNKGEIPFRIEYQVERRAVKRGEGSKATGDLDKFLKANTRVPVFNTVRKIFESTPDGTGTSLTRRIYDQVDQHMRYDKPKEGGWGRGDTNWACDSGFGNCTDFHSLYISVSRELGVPAKFQIGFPIPAETEGAVAGYHCWAASVVDGRWFPVDISEADKDPAKRDYYFGNLDPNRVRFTEGRDLKLTPRNESGPVNFLVYPHVEVDGAVHNAFRKGFRHRAMPKKTRVKKQTR